MFRKMLKFTTIFLALMALLALPTNVLFSETKHNKKTVEFHKCVPREEKFIYIDEDDPLKEEIEIEGCEEEFSNQEDCEDATITLKIESGGCTEYDIFSVCDQWDNLMVYGDVDCEWIEYPDYPEYAFCETSDSYSEEAKYFTDCEHGSYEEQEGA